MGTYFTYYNNTDTEIIYIKIEYISRGGLYSYPEFQDLNESSYNCIWVDKLYPSENTVYSKTQEYQSNRAINCLTGDHNPGQYIQFTYILGGGARYELTVPVFDEETI